VLLRSKVVVVSDCGKGVRSERQVSTEKMSASEPLMTHRKSLIEAVKTEIDNLSQEKPEGYLFTVQVAVGVKAA